MPDRHQPTRRALLAALPVAAITGCGQRTEPIAVDDALDHYTQVVDAVMAAMDTVRELDWDGGATALQPPEPCAQEYHPGRWEADGTLFAEPGQGMDWDPWTAALDPVLEDWGFSALGREEREGGWLLSRATDQHGATFELVDRGIVSITGARLADDACG